MQTIECVSILFLAVTDYYTATFHSVRVSVDQAKVSTSPTQEGHESAARR